MVYGETGRFPLYVTVYRKMICYWSKLLLSPESKIVCILYKYLYDKVGKKSYQNVWLSCIRNIFNSCGYSNIWNDQMHLFINNKGMKTSVEQRLKDQYIKKWQRDIRESSKGQIHVYNIFKTEFGPENILIHCLKNLEQNLLNLEPQITISQSKLGDGVAPQSLNELAMSAIGVK